MSGFVLAILVAGVTAAYNLCARIWVVDSKSPLAFSILYTSFAAIFSVGLLLLEPWQFVDSSPFWILALVVAGLLYGLYDATQFSARKYMEASTLALFSQLAPIITLVLAVFILGEDFLLSKLLAVACILAGNFIVLYKRGEHSIVLKGLWFSLASATFVGFAYFVDKSTFEHFPMALYAVAVYVIPAVVVGVIFKFTGGTKLELIDEFRRTSWKIPALSFIGVFCFYLLLKTYEITPLSIAIPLIYSSTILTTLGGIFLLNEKNNVLRKIVAAILVFTGVLLLK